MSDINVNQALALSGGEESMENDDLDNLNESKENAEQDLDKSDGVMEVTPADPQVKVVPEATYQELVETGNKRITSDNEDENDHVCGQSLKG